MTPRAAVVGLTAILSGLTPCHALTAQQATRLTADDYARAERLLPQNLAPSVTGSASAYAWLDDGRLWYRVTVEGGARFRIADSARRTTAPAFDHARLATALSTASGARVTETGLGTLSPSADAVEVTALAGGRRWTCTLRTYACVAADTGAGATAPPSSVRSPDGRYAAYLRDHDLWVRDLTTGEDRALTTDGVEDFGYATNNAGWIRGDAPVLLWSPDSRKIATFQHDGRGVGRMYLVTTNVGAPRLEAWRYPLPSDSVVFRIHRVIIDVESARVVRLDMPPDEHRSTTSDHVADGSTFLDVQWYPDASHVAFVSSSRDHKQATLRVADAATGEVRDVLTERSPTQFQSAFAGVGNPNWRVLASTNEVLWWSQRDDWGHLYLYDLANGALIRQVTSGSWNVLDVLRVDERARTLLVTGVGREPGRDPYYQHLYSVDLGARRGVTLLTPEDAHHAISLSPDGAQLVDTYSTITTPPVVVLRRPGQTEVTELARTDVSALVARGWKPPTPIVVKARDGATDLYGLMYTPTSLDSTRAYPIVNYIYPGPWGSSAGLYRGFSLGALDHQALAELGFVVVALNGMGTELRSKSFADAYYGDMGDNGLPDQVAGMRELGRRHAFIDIERVGIWGHSGGGFAAAGAMFRYPDFFKVGISESGNHDNRNYEDDWGERFQGLLRSSVGSDNYESQANQLLAGNLRGKLLLAHGGMDDNVPPYNTYLVVEALVRANKDFDLILFPNAGHGYGSSTAYMMRRRWDYFVRHLLGAEPPTEYLMGAGR